MANPKARANEFRIKIFRGLPICKTNRVIKIIGKDISATKFCERSKRPKEMATMEKTRGFLVLVNFARL